MLNGALVSLLHTPLQRIESINEPSFKKQKKKETKIAEWITDVNEGLLYSFSHHSLCFLPFPFNFK